MEVPFNFKHTAIGIDFIGREIECNTLSNLLRQMQNVLIYGPDGVGKQSLINKILIDFQKGSLSIIVCNVNLHNVRCEEDFYRVYAEQVKLSGLSSFQDLYRISNGDMEDNSVEHILSMPESLAAMNDAKVIVYLEEFNNVLHFDDPDTFLKRLEKVWGGKTNVTYLVTGSKTNAMKYIFEEKKYFYGQIENLPLLPLNEKAASDYIIRTFLRVGRVIDKEHVKLFYDISGGHPYYLWLLCSFSFNMTKGYVTPDIRDEAIASVLSLRESYFKGLVDSLSNFQLSLLRAIFDGVTKFSNKEVIERYSLNSSANVFRLKEALKKKEIICFDDRDEPYFIDPIFKYWLSKVYFV